MTSTRHIGCFTVQPAIFSLSLLALRRRGAWALVHAQRSNTIHMFDLWDTQDWACIALPHVQTYL